MGRSYWFECPQCGYRASVSGGADRGMHLWVQTILCRDCRALYDAVTRLRLPAPPDLAGQGRGLRPVKSLAGPGALKLAPSFQSAVNRLPSAGLKFSRWVPFRIQCPVSAQHRVQTWNDPGRCPRCNLHLEKNALPYRIWD
jgi:hypothetical protein